MSTIRRWSRTPIPTYIFRPNPGIRLHHLHHSPTRFTRGLHHSYPSPPTYLPTHPSSVVQLPFHFYFSFRISFTGSGTLDCQFYSALPSSLSFSLRIPPGLSGYICRNCTGLHDIYFHHFHHLHPFLVVICHHQHYHPTPPTSTQIAP